MGGVILRTWGWQVAARSLIFTAMSLLTAHKILISSAVALFVGYALWEIHNFTATGDGWALPRAGAAALAAVGFAIYLRSVWRREAL